MGNGKSITQSASTTNERTYSIDDIWTDQFEVIRSLAWSKNKGSDRTGQLPLQNE
jgi:hypothetical protein